MRKGFTLNELIMIVLFVAVLAMLPLYVSWTDTNLDYVLSLIKGRPVNVPLWLSTIFSIVTTGLGLMFNLLATIMRGAN